MNKYKSEYSKWFWSECDQLNKDTSFAHRLAEKSWNHQQAKIDELQARIEKLLDYTGTSGHTPNWIIKEFLK